MNIFNGFYSVIVIVVAFIALIRGYSLGISKQIATLLGFSFGAVAARVLAPDLTAHFIWAAKYSQAPEFDEFSINLVCAIAIYSVVFFFFFLLSPIFRLIFAIFRVGIINRLVGAFFSFVKNLLWLSIAYNLLLCFSDKSGLLYYEESNDGNIVGAVMEITPSVLGCFGASDFAHFNQLKHAKTIS